MRKYIIALLILFLALAPVQIVSAAEVVSSEDYFEPVDGENEEIHYDIYAVTTSDTTLSSSSPGAVKFNYIQGNTYQAAAPSPSAPQELQSVVLNGIKITDDKGNFSSVKFSTPIVLNGIGDVSDCIVKKDGVWKIERNVPEVVFDGSDDEAWTVGSTNTEGLYRLSIPIADIKKNTDADTIPNILSTHFRAVTPRNTYTNVEGISVSTSGILLIYSSAYNTSDVSLWKAHLAENPITVQYEVAQPTYEDLPTADQIALDKLETFQGTSYVSFDSAISPEFQLEYYSFVKKVYDYSLEQFVGFMRGIFDFVATEFTIWGFTFSYWQIIILSCLASIIGYFIHEVFN